MLYQNFAENQLIRQVSSSLTLQFSYSILINYKWVPIILLKMGNSFFIYLFFIHNVGLRFLDFSQLIQLFKLINYVKLYANCGGTNKSPNKLNAMENKLTLWFVDKWGKSHKARTPPDDFRVTRIHWLIIIWLQV